MTEDQDTHRALVRHVTMDPQGQDREPDAADRVLSDLTIAVDQGALPEITYLLLSVGLVCVVFRLAAPGFGAAGVALAVLVLSLGGIGLLAMPVTGAALLLLGLAAAALGMELLAFPGFGLHAVGGGVSLLLAGLYLLEEPFAVHVAVVIPAALATSVITYLAGRRSWRYVEDHPLDGSRRLVGRRTVVLTAHGSTGYVFLADQVWEICSDDGPLEPGGSVHVTRAFDDWLLVESAPRPPRQAHSAAR